MDMVTFWNTFATYVRARFGKDERGASLVEYALLVALIAIVCVVFGANLLGDGLRDALDPRLRKL